VTGVGITVGPCSLIGNSHVCAGNGTSKATVADDVAGQQLTADPKAGQAHERAAAQTRPHQGPLLHSDSAQVCPP